MTPATPPPASNAARWAPRLCAASPFVALVSIAVGLFDPEGGENLIAASALAIAFVGVAFGLGGLFTTLLASERADGFRAPRWALPCAIGGIGANFLAGILGVIT
jgi:hypothetical protein